MFSTKKNGIHNFANKKEKNFDDPIRLDFLDRYTRTLAEMK